MLTTILTQEGYHVSCCETAAAALEILSSVDSAEQNHSRPDLVVLDLTLPDMDGVEMISRLEIAAPPIIVTSATATHIAMDAGRRIGAALVLPKPFSVQQLLTGIEGLLARSLKGAKM